MFLIAALNFGQQSIQGRGYGGHLQRCAPGA
jgi:hypothetical protein